MIISPAKNALITGASRGFGAALALHLGQQGFHIIALARSQSGLERLDDTLVKATGSHATLIPFDLAGDEAHFNALGQTLFTRFAQLQLLVLNAATLPGLRPVAQTPEAEWQQVMAVNFFANTRLLRSLDPLLRRTPPPRIRFITCTQPEPAYWGAYRTSKHALADLAASYAAETRQAGFEVSCFDPGPMPTHLRAVAFPGEAAESLPSIAAAVARF